VLLLKMLMLEQSLLWSSAEEVGVVTVTVQVAAQVGILKIQPTHSLQEHIQLSSVLVEQVLHLQEEGQTEPPVHFIRSLLLAAEVEREGHSRLVQTVDQAEVLAETVVGELQELE
jgi:hypothetical protein